MDTNIILRALEAARYLINDEYQSLCDEDLDGEYQAVLAQIEEAILEIGGEGSGD